MANNPIAWASDTEVSMPEPREPGPTDVDLGGGHVFTPSGLAHKFTHTDAEVYFAPTYAPLPSPEGATG